MKKIINKKGKWILLFGFLCFCSLLMIVNFSLAGTLGGRLPDYGGSGGFVTPATENLDMDGYNLLKVGGITGDGGPTLFGDENTSHGFTDDGDIVVNKVEVNGKVYMDSGFEGLGDFNFLGNVYMGGFFTQGYGNKSRISDNWVYSFGTGYDYYIGYSTVVDKFQLGVGTVINTTVAFEINNATDCAVINNLSVGEDLILGNGEFITNDTNDYIRFENDSGYDCEFEFNTSRVSLNCDRAELRLRAANGGAVSIYDGNATPILRLYPSVTTTNAYIEIPNVTGPPNPSPNLNIRNLDTGDINLLSDSDSDVLIGDGSTDNVKIANNGVLSFIGTARMSFQSKTEAELKALDCTGFAEGTPYWDSTNKAVVTSTGTSTGSFGLITDGTSLPTGW